MDNQRVASELLKLAKSLTGGVVPGVPDGTGPMGDTDECQLNDEVISASFSKLTRRVSAGSETARDALYTLKGSLKQVKADIAAIRSELRENGSDREADSFYMDALSAYNELVEAFKDAERR